jgi:predicted RNase H-like HicB family nuclease
MLISYPAIFYYSDKDEPSGYFIHFPDFDAAGTQSVSIEEGMEMASDWLGIHAAHYFEQNEVPPKPSSINNLSPEKNNPFKHDEEYDFIYDKEKTFVTLVAVDLKDYLGINEPVKKTLTIPKWADKRGKDLKLNFSQTLTEAIVNKSIQRQ